jgi:hypothetical protein
MLSGCVSYKLSKADRVYEIARTLPNDARPALYLQALQEGSLTANDYTLAMQGWRRQKSLDDANVAAQSQTFTQYATELRENAIAQISPPVASEISPSRTNLSAPSQLISPMPAYGIAENGSYYGQPNQYGIPKTVRVSSYFRKDGTYVRGHYRSSPRRSKSF